MSLQTWVKENTIPYFPNKELARLCRVCQDQDAPEPTRREAMDLVVKSNLPFVLKQVRGFMQMNPTSATDIFQVGVIGLHRTVLRYEEEKGPFLNYAKWWVMAEVKAYVQKQQYPVTTYKKGWVRGGIKMIKQLASQQRGRKGSVDWEEVIEQVATTCRLSTVQADLLKAQWNAEYTPPLYLDEASVHTEKTLHDRLADEGTPADEALIDLVYMADFRAALRSFEATLTGRDLFVWKRRLFRTDPHSEETLREVAKPLGISREAVRLRQKSIKIRFKEFLKINHPQFLEE